MESAAQHHNLPAVSVSEISMALKRMVEDQFGYVRVRGEISGWRGPHSSGHAYFKIKDDKAVLDAVCWRGQLARLSCKLEEGLEVIATGKITTYPGRSNYQIVVDSVEPAGLGALLAQLEKRRKMLEAEGLFADERKKPIPFLPSVIGVVTSPTGAVIRDILHRITDRFGTHVLVWPVAVQGDVAAEQIAAAIAGFNALPEGGAVPRPDVLIVGRGGGSIEDLWPFNEEVVVRAAANSAIPLISAVGHETDTTLIDYVSDWRAPTPTAAAEKAVPVRADLQAAVLDLEHRLNTAAISLVERSKERVRMLYKTLPRPEQLIEQRAQRLDDWAERLQASLPQFIRNKEQHVAVIAARISPRMLLKECQLLAQRVQPMEDRLISALQRYIEKREQSLLLLQTVLTQLDFKKVLARGFALVRSPDQALVTRAADARKHPSLLVEFADGTVEVKP